jgi:hypothetical protein
MSAFPDYLLKLSVSLAVIALFYHLVLRKLTFYNNNRHFLRFYSALCFMIPLININHFIAPEPTPARVFVQSVPTITRLATPEIITYRSAAAIENHISYANGMDSVHLACRPGSHDVALTGTRPLLSAHQVAIAACFE